MELGGNPNKKNARNETSLHSVCMVLNARLNYAIQQRRLECLSLILQWRGATLENGEVERIDLSTQDEVCLSILCIRIFLVELYNNILKIQVLWYIFIVL